MSYNKPIVFYPDDALANRGMSASSVRLIYKVQAQHGYKMLGYFDWLYEIRDRPLLETVSRLRDTGTLPNVQYDFAQFLSIDFYRQSLSREYGGALTGRVAELIVEAFGSAVDFRREVLGLAARSTGPSFIWLSYKEGRVVLQRSDGHSLPEAENSRVRPLTCLSIAEHAYVLDYGEDKLAYVDNFLTRLINYKWANDWLRIYER